MAILTTLKGGAPIMPPANRVLCHPETFLRSAYLLYVAKSGVIAVISKVLGYGNVNFICISHAL